jgi:TolB-like protein/Tfp pilus assembly protein PilF
MTDLRERVQAALGSNYTIERELGGGGMGRVFRVRDEVLGRSIVVKVLPADDGPDVSAERFKREIQFIAQLQHANIVPLLTAGDAGGIPYYVMPYIDGESLRRRLAREAIPIPEIVGLLKDVARALLYAHDRGVVHRDIKPDNVLVSGGAAVVTDFGIAKALSAARGLDPTRPGTLTSVGTTIGTPAYMAPEQASGDPSIDHRADIYSFGCLAYELITRQLPFPHSSPHLLFAAHLKETPPPIAPRRPDCPPALAQLVERCLEKDPDRRPQSARAIIEQLDGLATSSGRASVHAVRRGKLGWIAAAVTVVVAAMAVGLAMRGRSTSNEPQLLTVLPFLAIGGDSAQAYLADGMSEELATALGKTRGVRVVGRTAANKFRGQRDVDVRAVGEALGVGLVVQGNLRHSTDGLRVNAQLTDARTGEEIWADSYQRSTSDVLAVHDAITRGIIGALRERNGGIGAAPSVATRGSADPEAYDLYLRGQYLLRRRAVPQAAAYFERAIARDSGFARAYAGLSTSLALFPYFTSTPASAVEARLRSAAERALGLDSSLAEPHTALAMDYMHRYRWDSSHAKHRRAVTLDPSDHEAHLQYGRLLAYLGLADSALAEFRRAAAIDPFSALYSAWIAGELWLQEKREPAVNELRRAIELDSLNPIAVQYAGRMSLETGDTAVARRSAGRLPKLGGWIGISAYLYGRLGDRAKVDSIVRIIERDRPWFGSTTLAYAALGRRDTTSALQHLEAASRAGEYWAAYYPIRDQFFDLIRRSARFAALVRATGLSPTP